jgi:hypothetical protein
VTRDSGFSVSPDATGGEFRKVIVDGYRLAQGASISLEFTFPDTAAGQILGYGAWFSAPASFAVQIVGEAGEYVLTNYRSPDWDKFGSQWFSDGGATAPRLFVLRASEPGVVALWGPAGGRVDHEHLRDVRPALMRNMHQIAPEANFIVAPGDVKLRTTGSVEPVGAAATLYLKSCNRCARFLPINYPGEREHLSFSNHCVAESRRPCSHSTFGRLRDAGGSGEILVLDYGFQLECRFDKKFEVNAAHNPMRTAAQMKEDAARRRAFELLLAELYGGNPLLRYRRDHDDRELADDVFRRFGGRCFKCGVAFDDTKSMALDHTRPLALLWPLDEHATALCAVHNSEKRDRPPSRYYTPIELDRLAKITGLPRRELASPSPNVEAIKKLHQKLDWFLTDFVQRDEMQEIHDGKRPADLLVKALQKAIDRLPPDDRFDLQAAYDRSP